MSSAELNRELCPQGEQYLLNCRLMGSFAVRLSETAATWGRAVAPVAEWVANELWTTVKKPPRLLLPATRLTQNHRREARGPSANLSANNVPPKPIRVCHGCGTSVKRDSDYCSACGLVVATGKLLEAGQAGRKAAQSAEAQASRAETQRRNAIAQRTWKNSSEITEETYAREIQPQLRNYQFRQLLVRCASPGPTLPIFAKERNARMRGIGRRSDN